MTPPAGTDPRAGSPSALAMVAERAADAAPDGPGVVLTPFSQIEPRGVDWLWRHRVPMGTLTLLEGPAGIGKTTAVFDLLARVSRGHAFPDGAPALCGDVVIVGPEDAAESVLRPRLDAAGADLDRVYLATRPGDDALLLPSHVPVLRDALAHCECPRVLYLDALNDLLVGVKINDDADVRRALRPLVKLAEECGVAVVATRHFGKSGNRHAALAGLGSVGFGSVARSVLQVYRDADDSGRLLLASAKSNLGPTPPTLAFALVPGGDDQPPRVEWRGADTRSADELQRAYREDDSEGGAVMDATNEACDFLSAQLADGPKPKTTLVAAAKAEGIATRTLERAKQRLGVRRMGLGFGGGAAWALPDAPEVVSEDVGAAADSAHVRHARQCSPHRQRGEHGEHAGEHGENGPRVLARYDDDAEHAA